MRLHAQTDVFEQGLVYLPNQAPWLDDYRSELLGFPGTKFYDQVDSTAQAIDFIKTNYRKNLAVWERLAG
jgi:predicted phage terminase large subunit-like protein